MRIGAHISAAGGFENAIKGGLEIDCESVQMFVKSNRSWAGRAVKPEEYATFKEARDRQAAVSSIFCHGTYLVNLAAEDADVLSKSIMCFELEYALCINLGLDYLVFHPGAPKKMGLDKGIAQIVSSLNDIAKRYPKSPVKILLENDAGQGSRIGREWSELRRILDKLEEPERYGICFDTCHAFASGHDIRTEKAYEKTMKAVDDQIGIDRLYAFHLNDSEYELGSNHDRHAHIGEGYIKTEGFRWLVNDPRFKNRPGTIETPDSEKFPQDLARLKGLRNMSHKRSPKVPTKDSFVADEAASYQGARWMERLQHATTRRALELLGDERVGGGIPLGAKAAGAVLDIGCGNGFSTEVIMESGFRVAVGIDISADMLALRHLPNPVVQADMARLPFRDGTFSFVISISAMNFLSQDVEEITLARKIYDTFARQVYALLTPGGRGVVEFYPKSPAELDAITRAFGSRSGFQGFLVIDKPGTRKEQKFLVFRK